MIKIIGLLVLALLALCAVVVFGLTALLGKTIFRLGANAAQAIIGGGKRVVVAVIAIVFLIAFICSSSFAASSAKSYKAERNANSEDGQEAGSNKGSSEKPEEDQANPDDGLASNPAEAPAADVASEPEPEAEPEPDWDSMEADYLLDKPNMVDGALRALEMTERDYHRFEEEYGRVYDRQSANEMAIYRISHMERLNAFGLSLIANQEYFEKNEEDLEYLYAIDVSEADLDDKVFAKARLEMSEQYKDWEEELRDLDPDDKNGKGEEYEEYFRDKFKEELVHNPLFCIGFYDFMSKHVVFTKNNPWVKDDLEQMLKAYKLDPKVVDTVGTATFLTYSPEHKDDETECSYEHIIINDEMWEYACKAARMFELCDYDGVQKKTSMRNWALKVDDDVPDLTCVEMLDKEKDQVKYEAPIYSVKENGKNLVVFGQYCYDGRLTEYAVGTQQKKSSTKKTVVKYNLGVYYRELGTTKDLISPKDCGKVAPGTPYGPFKIPNIQGYTPVTKPEETKGIMPKDNKAVFIWYVKNGTTTQDSSSTGQPSGGGDPDDGGGGGGTPTGDQPKNPAESSTRKPENNQGTGQNDNKGTGDQSQTDPGKTTEGESSGGGNDNSNENSGNNDNTNHEGEGADSAPSTGKPTTSTEPSGGNGDTKTTNPGGESNTGHVSSD